MAVAAITVPLLLLTILNSVSISITHATSASYHLHHFRPDSNTESHYFTSEELSRVRRQTSTSSSQFPPLPNITAEDVRFAVTRAQEIVSHRFDYFQPQIYNAGKNFIRMKTFVLLKYLIVWQMDTYVCIVYSNYFYIGSFHKPGSAAWFMSTSHKANPSAQNISRISLLSEEASHIITQK